MNLCRFVEHREIYPVTMIHAEELYVVMMLGIKNVAAQTVTAHCLWQVMQKNVLRKQPIRWPSSLTNCIIQLARYPCFNISVVQVFFQIDCWKLILISCINKSGFLFSSPRLILSETSHQKLRKRQPSCQISQLRPRTNLKRRKKKLKTSSEW